MVTPVLLLATAIFAALTLRLVTADVKVVDGDTIRRKGVDWRITGLDAPEWDQPGGRAATAHLADILRTGHAIAFVRGGDAYGRPLATILTPLGPLSWRMAITGNAHGTGIVGGALTGIARLLGRGLWGLSGPTYSPRQWREGVR